MNLIILIVSALLFAQPPQPSARPTSENDPMPPPTLEYFVGTWAFEWNLPDSALGSGGKIEGKETCARLDTPVKLAAVAGYPDLNERTVPPQALDGSVYQCLTDARGPEGPIRVRAVMALDAAKKTVTRHEVDSRGFSTTKTGPIGGDLGGYYSIFWDATPIVMKGETVKLKGRTIMYSPVSYRIEYKIATASGKLLDFGRPWYKKE